MPKVRLALAQTNPVVGDLKSNLDGCLRAVTEAASLGANLVVFGEMAMTGYPVEDLAARPDFLADCEAQLSEFARALEAAGFGEMAVVIGHPAVSPVAEEHNWAIAQNRASVCLGGEITHSYAKHHLPNYSVFDEYRIFVPGSHLTSFDFQGLRFSLLICEDIWQRGGPTAQVKNSGSDVVLVLNGSPFEVDKQDRRDQLVQSLATENDCAVAYVNLVGGQDDLVFDGASLVCNAAGQVVARGAAFKDDLVVVDILNRAELAPVKTETLEQQDELSDIWDCLVLGLADYVNKNGFKSVILGLSGGIDSAVCAALAVDALGPERVFGVSLPSKYSSDHSKSDAQDLAQRLGINLRTETIEAMVSVAEEQLGLTGLAAENLQARVRGVILMGLSNQEGHLTLTTGNKTEIAVGYSTIYGDSVGGFAPLKDVAKTLVWDLAKHRNALAKSRGELEPIPENSIVKPPSAELRPGQVDQDSLPEYEELDRILYLLLEKRQSKRQIVDQGFAPETVERVATLFARAEWKRRQGAIGPKITGLAFGRDHRMPITNKYH
ncbi:MAG: NAD+ synthase [Micrococcales bacterium]